MCISCAAKPIRRAPSAFNHCNALRTWCRETSGLLGKEYLNSWRDMATLPTVPGYTMLDMFYLANESPCVNHAISCWAMATKLMLRLSLAATFPVGHHNVVPPSTQLSVASPGRSLQRVDTKICRSMAGQGSPPLNGVKICCNIKGNDIKQPSGIIKQLRLMLRLQLVNSPCRLASWTLEQPLIY